MDGTLLGSNNLISSENVQAIKDAQDAGIQVIISTGRSFVGANYPLEKANLQLPVICMNGAQIYNNGRILRDITIPKETIQSCFTILNKYPAYFEVYTNNGHISINGDKYIETLANIFYKKEHLTDSENNVDKIKARFTNLNIRIIDNYHVLLDDPSTIFYKILAFSADKKVLNAIENELKNIPSIVSSSSGFQNLEINHVDGQKGLALDDYVKRLGISLQETMAIGDSYNDVSMLEKAGFAVAMGNAPEDIKKIAHYVTDSNDNHGFAKAVYKVIEMNKSANENE